MAAKKTTKTASKKKPAPPKAAPATKTTARKPSSRSAASADKSVEEFRNALERSYVVSRDRLQEVVDDAVKRGQMTRSEANKRVAALVKRGRRQTDQMVKELERTLEATRKQVERSAKKARKQVETRGAKARKSAEKNVKRATRAAIDVADEPLAQADKLRRRSGVGGPPITAYDELTVAQVKARLAGMDKASLRKVRTQEKRGKARKSVLDAIEQQLA